MQKFIPRDKLSKKMRKQLDGKKRGSWGAISPVTRKAQSKKLYNRKRTDKSDAFTFVGLVHYML